MRSADYAAEHAVKKTALKLGLFIFRTWLEAWRENGVKEMTFTLTMREKDGKVTFDVDPNTVIDHAG